MKLIDKDAVIAELEKLRKEWSFGSSAEAKYRCECYTEMLNFLNTIEVKEVDLDYIKKELDDVVRIYKPNGNFGWGTLYNVATYFFELGLKTKQESNDEVKIGETQIYLEDDGGEPPYEGKQWLDLSCMEYEIPKTLFKDGDNVEIFIRKAQKGE